MSRRRLPLDFRAFVIGFIVAWFLFHWIGGGADAPPGEIAKTPQVLGARGPDDPFAAAPCDDAFGRFVGLHEGRVAVFAGSPDGCRLLLGTQAWSYDDLQPFLRDDLEKGIVFYRDDELFQIMEGLAAP